MTTRKKKPEADAVETKVEAQVETKSSTKSKGNHPIEFYKGAGIPFCEFCGAPRSTGLSGEIICPEQQANCPQLAAELD